MEGSGALFTIGPLEVTGAVVTQWAIIFVLALLSFLATRNLKEVPGKLQAVAEVAVQKLRDYFDGTLGTEMCRKYFPIFATFFVFIIVSNYSGLIPGAGHFKGFKVPTSSLSVTAGFAIVSFFTVIALGIKERGLKAYLKSFITPVALLLPLNVLEQFIHPFSLALRLYGNLYGEEMVMDNLYEVFPLFLPLIMQVLSLIFCYIQALVFTMLLSIYVSEAVESEE